MFLFTAYGAIAQINKEELALKVSKADQLNQSKLTEYIRKRHSRVFVDDKASKPIAIHRFVGKVPVFSAGNSDGDQAMMQYTSGNPYKNFNLILHHTDSVREYKYDIHTLSGHLETTLFEAKERNWLVVDMQKDFKKVFSFVN